MNVGDKIKYWGEIYSVVKISSRYVYYQRPSGGKVYKDTMGVIFKYFQIL